MLFLLQNMHTFRSPGQANFKRLLKISLNMLIAIWQKQNTIFEPIQMGFSCKLKAWWKVKANPP